jgi:hypothetical protein
MRSVAFLGEASEAGVVAVSATGSCSHRHVGRQRPARAPVIARFRENAWQEKVSNGTLTLKQARKLEFAYKGAHG